MTWWIGRSSILLWLVFALAIVVFASGASKPLQLDNMDFPAVSSATAATGLPVYYRGEASPAALGLYHPPLYIYLLAGWIKLFGMGEAQVRLFGLVCIFLQGAVVLRILGTLFGRHVLRRCVLPFWAVFLLNPYTIQTASIADIDSTIYGPLLFAYLLSVLRLSWREGEWRTDAAALWEYVPVVLLAILCLWAKLTTVLLFLPFSCLLLMPRLKFWRAVLVGAGIVATAAAGFAVSYAAYGAVSGLNVGYTYSFTLASMLTKGSSGAPGLAGRVHDFYANALQMTRFMVNWTGLFPWVAAGVGALVFGGRGVRARQTRHLHYAALLSLALLTTLYYCGKTMTFGAAPFKYVFVCWGMVLTGPVLLIFADGEGAWRAVAGRRWRGFAWLGLFAVCLLWGSFKLQDATILNSWRIFHPSLIGPVLLLAAGSVPLLTRTVRTALLTTAFTAYCGLLAGMAVYQSRAEYSTTYDYGQTGFADAVGFLRANTSAEDRIVSMKDIGFKAGRKYFESYDALYGDRAETHRLIDAIAARKAKYVVFTERRGEDQLVVNPFLKEWILRNCRLVQSYGDYRVYSYAGQ